MCGIVAALSERSVTSILLAGLRRLEYRGYDSAGIAVIDGDGEMQCTRMPGKVEMLAAKIDSHPINGRLGIAHTRWATHGEPSEANAHPHSSGKRISVVHNGIIENHEQLRDELSDDGYEFSSQTDSEVIAHLIHRETKKSGDFVSGARTAIRRLTGAYAIAAIDRLTPDTLIGARLGNPLILGIGIGETFIASDPMALLAVTQQFISLRDGDIAIANYSSRRIEDSDGKPCQRELVYSNLALEKIEKSGYKHYMLKEIHEQPQALQTTLQGRFDEDDTPLPISQLPLETLRQCRHLQFVACGTSYFACLTARYWFEHLLGIPCSVDHGSEFLYRSPAVPKNSLYITLSQSGETADSLRSLEWAGGQNYLSTLAVCNVAESSITHAAKAVLLTRAGPEIGVASTKTFTSQLATLIYVLQTMARARDRFDGDMKRITGDFRQLPSMFRQVLALEEPLRTLADRLLDKRSTIFIGRGSLYPIALEGALKFKELAYTAGDAYPAGELKHGPLALIDETVQVIALVNRDEPLLDKMRSNLEELRARNGRLAIIAEEGSGLKSRGDEIMIELPRCPYPTRELLFAIPLQLIAYFVADYRGHDVDQPRNLAKSVTVE